MIDTDKFSATVLQALSDTAGRKLLSELEQVYIRRPVFTEPFDPIKAAHRDGERNLVQTLINIVESHERTSNTTRPRTRKR